MPYKSEKIKLPPEYDRRRKLSDEQKEEIRHKYGTGLYSQRKLAREYNVSRSLIVCVVDNERYERLKAQRRERAKDGRYKCTKEQGAAIMRERRAYKQRLYLEGKIKLED